MSGGFAACWRPLAELIIPQYRHSGISSSCRLWNENQRAYFCSVATTPISRFVNNKHATTCVLVFQPPSCRINCKRRFIRLPKSLIDAAAGGGKRKDYSETRLLGYSAEQMYNVVRQVDMYPEFVPWCMGVRMRHRGGDENEGSDIAVMEVGFPPISERYTSIVTYCRPHMVQSVANDGRMFKYMFTQWKFQPGKTEQSCMVDFSISFEFKNVLHSSLANMFFEEVARKMVGAFLTRANEQYGPPSLQDQRLVHQSVKS